MSSTNTSAGNDAIDRLATYIAAGEEGYERDRRLKTAVEILCSAVESREERKTLAARLDEAVAAKTKASENSLVQSARTAFEKIAGIFGGGE